MSGLLGTMSEFEIRRSSPAERRLANFSRAHALCALDAHIESLAAVKISPHHQNATEHRVSSSSELPLQARGRALAARHDVRGTDHLRPGTTSLGQRVSGGFGSRPGRDRAPIHQ